MVASEKRYAKTEGNRRYRYAFLGVLAILLFYTAYIWRTFSGYYFYDDYEYAYAAFRLWKGSFFLAYDTFSHRLAFIALISCAYALLGMSDFTTILLPAFAFFGTLTVLFLYLRRQETLCFYTLVITGLNSYFLFFIDKLTPDTLVAFFCLLAGVIAQQYRHTYPVKAGAGVAFLLFAAFLTKETSMYIWPFFGLLILTDWLQHTKRARVFVLSTVSAGLVLSVVYLLGYYIYTGDAFYRFSSIMDNHYTHAESYYDKPFSHLWARLTYAPWQMFTESGLLVAILPGLFVAVRLIFFKKFTLQSQEGFWSWFALIFLFCFYFGTTSLRYYNPLNLLPRMYFPLLPPFAILAGIFWVKAEHSPKVSILLGILLGTVAAYCLVTHSKYTPVYAGYAAAAFMPLIIRLTYSELVMRTFFVLVSLTIPLYRMIQPQQWGYQAEKKIFQTHLRKPSGKNLVITDNRLTLTHHWFYRFESPANYHFVDFAASYQVPDTHYTHTYVLFNPHTFRESFGSFEEWNRWEQQHKDQLTIVTMLDEVVLYEWKATAN